MTRQTDIQAITHPKKRRLLWLTMAQLPTQPFALTFGCKWALIEELNAENVVDENEEFDHHQLRISSQSTLGMQTRSNPLSSYLIRFDRFPDIIAGLLVPFSNLLIDRRRHPTVVFRFFNSMAAQKEEDIQLPEKINNDNEFRPIGPVGVLINAFELNLKSAPDKAGKKGKEPQLETRELARGPRNDESKETRRELHWALWQILLEQNAEFFGGRKSEFSYDCALLLYSIRRLMRNGETREFVITPESLEGLSERSRSYLKSGCERIKASLMATEEVEVRNVHVTEPGGDRSVCQFLELLSTQRMHDKNEHFVFGNRMFEKNSVVTLQGDPRICKDGMQKNVRFVGDNPNNSSAIIQLDAKKSAFFPAMPVIDFVGRFIGSNANTIEHDFSRPGTVRMINKQIKGLSVHTTHLAETQMSFCASGLTDRSASDLTFMMENHEMNLVHYYEQKYNRRLRYPRLPCVIHRRGSRESFFPMEVLQIIDGQRVTLDKQTPKLTEQMIRKCQVLPFELPRGIEAQRDMGMIQNANPFFRAHEIRVETNMMQAEAQHLYPPALAFAAPNEQLEPNARGVLDFRLAERGQPIPRRYPVPCEFPKTWAVVIVQNAVRKEQCRQFCENLIRCAQARGVQMGMPPRVDQFDDTSIENIREQFSFFSKHRCQFVLFFAPGKESAHAGDVHHVFKLQEVEHGVLTQHVSPKIMEKATGRQGAIMVLDNIMLKMNLKMGGVNYDICAAQAFKQANGLRHDIVSEQWLGGKRMFFGLELSHAPPQTLFERRMGKAPAIPTIVGMAYTVSKHMLKLNGTYWMQQPRVTTVQMAAPMVNAVKEALMTFNGLNGCFPEHIFVFRAGASEGEYKKVAYWEGGAFETAFAELIKERKMAKRPFLTMIVCQRNSNYRIIPKNVQQGGRAPEQNCQPGTVLDKRAMHSSLTEFLLVGHRTIQGTAQPLRCTVVVDTAEPRIKLSELEQISYALCYQHGICCSPTAVPGVLYSAGDLATRGRNNWRTSTGDGDHIQQFDLPPQDQSDQVRADMQAQLDEQRAQYFAQVTDELRPTIPTKFWA
uniref:Piwi domain-containing protein n=1 Tax=Globodera rostochiensis TaxID=31243 RepID=A0A914I7V1_GLORO